MAENGILFSFVIPTFNRSSLLKDTIDSILHSSACSLEVIVVDDGGSDNTEEVVKSFGDVRIIYKRIPNSERGAARNHGAHWARGKYLNFFDSDDLLFPCLDELSEFLEKERFPDVVYGIIDNGNALSTDSLPSTSFVTNLLHNNFLACGSVFLKREIASEFPFHEDRRLSSAEDWELWLRIRTRYEFLFFPKKVFRQVQHAGRSLSSIRPERVEARDSYFASLASTRIFTDFYGSSAINLFIADRYSFIALCWIATDRKQALRFIFRALSSSLRVVKRRRFWAVIKKLVVR